MRKPVKPFITEHKNGRKPPRPSALFDENDIFGNDEKPPRDVSAESEQPDDRGYDAALRAADAVFAKLEPQGQYEASEPSTATAEPEKRILVDLSYSDPLEARLAAVKEVRRGRKPGSKNKPKPAVEAPRDAEVFIEIEELVPAPVRAQAPALPRRVVTTRRQAPGFIKQLEAKRKMKPGQRWKLKIGNRHDR